MRILQLVSLIKRGKLHNHTSNIIFIF